MDSNSGELRDQSPAGSIHRARQRAMDMARQTPLPASKGPTPQNSSPSYRGSPDHRSLSDRRPSSPSTEDLRRKRSQEEMERPVHHDLVSESNYSADNTPSLLQPTTFGGESPVPINQRRARNHWEDGYSSPGTQYTVGSRPSTTATGSSTASIPDFPTIPSMPSMPGTPVASVMPPVPPIPQSATTNPPPRRNLGPPPSARRGASSYYSQTSFVPPIPEENSDGHMSPYASSRLMPSEWAEGGPEQYGSGIEEEDEGSTQGGESGRTSRAGDHTEESNLVKKGSPEKSFTPYMETLESGDESDNSVSGGRRRKHDEKWQMGETPLTDPIGRHNFRENGRLHYNPYSGYESDATFLDSPRSPPPHRPFPSTDETPSMYFASPSPPASPPAVDPRVGEILGHLEKGGALAPSGTVSPIPIKTPPTERESKRPPRLDLDPSKGGTESAKGTAPRGSASSLPDLIRRATRLASNLDRGRTSSRAGMLDLLNANEKEREKRKAEKTSRPGSISDILAAFPSPSPTISTYHKPSTFASPSPAGKSNLSRSHTVTYSSPPEKRPPPPRRCCGMPMWAFVLLIIILLLLIVAAVVIPVTLVVIPHHSGSSAATVESCQKSDPCGNGGSSVVFQNQCRCICTNAWTGATCNLVPITDGTCSITTLPQSGSNGPYQKVTFGNSIPRLISAAQPNYSIPLDGIYLASYFSYTNLSCASENALIAINQRSQRRSISGNLQEPLPVELDDLLVSYPSPSRASTSLRPSRILEARNPAQTSNDIIFAASPGSGSSPSASSGSGSGSASTASATTTAASATASSSSKASGTPITSGVLDFARTVILFVLQEKDLDTAKDVLDHIQTIFGGGSTYDPSQTSLSGPISVNWNSFSVNFGNGTNYGGKGNSNSS